MYSCHCCLAQEDPDAKGLFYCEPALYGWRCVRFLFPQGLEFTVEVEDDISVVSLPSGLVFRWFVL